MTMSPTRSFVSLGVIGALCVFAACSSDKTDSKKTSSGVGGTGTAGSAVGGTVGAGTGGVGGTAGLGGTAGMPPGGAAGSLAGTGGIAGAGMAGIAGISGTAGAGAGGISGDGGTPGGGTAGGGTAGGGTAGTGEGGEGGQGSCMPHDGTLYDGAAAFDDPGTTSGWVLAPETGNLGGLGDGFIQRNLTEGHLCPGALAATIPFTVYGGTEKASVERTMDLDWTGKTTMHVWVRIGDPGTGNISYLNGIQLFVQSMSYAVYSPQFVSAATFDDFAWHEIVLDLTATPAVVLDSVNKLGIQVLAQESRPPSAPAAPMTTVVYIDDVYVE